MEIKKDTLEKILKMAGLNLAPNEKIGMHEDLTKVVAWVQKLSEVDVEGIEPLATMSFETNRLREDVPEPPLPDKKALKNAPVREGNYFCVPKVKS